MCSPSSGPCPFTPRSNLPLLKSRCFVYQSYIFYLYLNALFTRIAYVNLELSVLT